MKAKDKSYIQEIVLSLLRTGEQNATATRVIKNATGLSTRDLKLVISDLREFYPICSKETDGGGYWLAANDDEINNFIALLERRIQSNIKTIEAMNNHTILG